MVTTNPLRTLAEHRSIAGLDLAAPPYNLHSPASTSRHTVAGELAAQPQTSARADAMTPDRAAFTARGEAAFINTSALDRLPVDVRKRIGNLAVKSAYRDAFKKENMGEKSPVVIKAVIAPAHGAAFVDSYAPRSISGEHLARAAGRGLPRAERSLASATEMLVPVRRDAFGRPHRVKSLYDGNPQHSYTVRYDDVAENLPTGKLANLHEYAFPAAAFRLYILPHAGFMHTPRTRVVNNEVRITHADMRAAFGRPDLPAVEVRRAAKTPDSLLEELMRATAGSARAFESGLGRINLSRTSRSYLHEIRGPLNDKSAHQLIVENKDGSRRIAGDEALINLPDGKHLWVGRSGAEAILTRTITAQYTNTDYKILDLQKAFDNPDLH